MIGLISTVLPGLKESTSKFSWTEENLSLPNCTCWCTFISLHDVKWRFAEKRNCYFNICPPRNPRRKIEGEREKEGILKESPCRLRDLLRENVKPFSSGRKRNQGKRAPHREERVRWDGVRGAQHTKVANGESYAGERIVGGRGAFV